MKINHSSENFPRVGPGAATDKAKSLDPTNDFASVFKEAAKTQPSHNMPVSASGRIAQTSMTERVQQPKTEPEIKASRLLDTLEDYQRVLADPLANLKQVQPMVDQMRAVASEAASMVEKMPDGHIVKGVMEETLLQINKEITRFEHGEYVDR